MERNRNFGAEDEIQKPGYLRRIVNGEFGDLGIIGVEVGGFGFRGNLNAVHTELAWQIYAERYCADRGWDPNNLSGEQREELMARPEMINPPHPEPRPL